MSRVESAAREVSPERVPSAVRAAQDWLLAVQHQDGHWCGELEGDSILESEYVIVLHFLGRLGDARVQKAARHLRRGQLEGGGWAIYPGGPAEVSASVKAYFALKLAGDDAAAPHMARARERILSLGGIDACNSFTKIYLALCGQYDWWLCPAVPPEMILLPRWFYFNLYEISSWSRAIVVPLSVVWALRPVRPVPAGCGLGELRETRPAGAAQRAGGTVMGGASKFWRGLFHLLDTGLKAGERLHLTPFRRRALARAEEWIRERLEDSDGLGAIFPPIVNTIFALCCLGHPPDEPLVRGQIHELEKLEIEEDGCLRLQPCFSSTWDTAIALHTLADSGLRPDHPALAQARRWLVEHEVTRSGDWTMKAPGARPGGWCFEYRNPFYPDCDDTAEVLAALSGLPGGREERAARRGLAWLLAMQNEDGGWGAFDRGCDKEILTHVPFADHNALLDPSTADVTGRVLDCLGRLGFARDARPVARGLAFLRQQQEADGSWYGRWGCNYIYGTWLAMRALGHFERPWPPEAPVAPPTTGGAPAPVATAGAPATAQMDEAAGNAAGAWCRQAVAWLVSHQNPDGGWGESPLSYDDPSRKGIGESTAAQTAWALMALFSADDITGETPETAETIERGVDYLLRTQREEGSWRDEPWTGTGFPRVFYLRYHLYATFFPLMALAEYERCRRGEPEPRAAQAYPHEVPISAGPAEGAVR